MSCQYIYEHQPSHMHHLYLSAVCGVCMCVCVYEWEKEKKNTVDDSNDVSLVCGYYFGE